MVDSEAACVAAGDDVGGSEAPAVLVIVVKGVTVETGVGVWYKDADAGGVTDSTLVGVWASEAPAVLVIDCLTVCVAEGRPEVVTVKLLIAEEEREKDGDGVTVLHGVVVRV